MSDLTSQSLANSGYISGTGAEPSTNLPPPHETAGPEVPVVHILIWMCLTHRIKLMILRGILGLIKYFIFQININFNILCHTMLNITLTPHLALSSPNQRIHNLFLQELYTH